MNLQFQPNELARQHPSAFKFSMRTYNFANASFDTISAFIVGCFATGAESMEF